MKNRGKNKKKQWRQILKNFSTELSQAKTEKELRYDRILFPLFVILVPVDLLFISKTKLKLSKAIRMQPRTT